MKLLRWRTWKQCQVSDGFNPGGLIQGQKQSIIFYGKWFQLHAPQTELKQRFWAFCVDILDLSHFLAWVAPLISVGFFSPKFFVFISMLSEMYFQIIIRLVESTLFVSK